MSMYILWREFLNDIGCVDYALVGIYTNKEHAIKGFNCYVEDWKHFQSELALAIMNGRLKRNHLENYYVAIGDKEKVFLQKVPANVTAVYGNLLGGEYLKKEA